MIKNRLITTAMMMALSAPTLAQGVYIGASAAITKNDKICEGITSRCDDKDSTVKLNIGYQFTPNWAIEAMYMDSVEYDADFGGVRPEVYEVDGYGLSIVGSYPINTDFSLSAKLGMFSWDAELTEAFGSGNPLSESGTDISYGLGAAYHVTPQIDLKLGWERLNIGSDTYVDSSDIDTLSIGVDYKFF